MDYAHIQTDLMLATLEQEIGNLYLQLYRALRKMYLEKYKGKETLTKAILHSKEWISFEKALAKRITKTNLLSTQEIQALMPKVYSFNANYAMYEIENGLKIRTAFDLVDESTVKMLLKGKNDVLPIRLNTWRDLRWNRQKIHSVVLRGILKGQTNREIAKLFEHVVGMNKNTALTNARTATTSAENGGRVYSYEQAESMGIELEQEWLATLDGRTRHSHRQLDGEKVKVGGVFSNGCRYPGDPQGRPEETYNCRCTLVAAIKGIDNSANVRHTTMQQTYEEWKKGKKVTYGESRDING